MSFAVGSALLGFGRLKDEDDGEEGLPDDDALPVSEAEALATETPCATQQPAEV